MTCKISDIIRYEEAGRKMLKLHFKNMSVVQAFSLVEQYLF